MLIDLKEIIQKYNLDIKGVIQVGCHWCEEHEIFKELKVKHLLYIEPCQDAYEVIIHKFSPLEAKQMGIFCLNAACADYDGESEMFCSSNNQGQSNSLLQPSLHLQQHPEIVFNESERVKVYKLDSIIVNDDIYNLLVMDTQGSEGLVLKGAKRILKNIDCIYTEINTDYTYENNMLVNEMDEYLSNFGFERVETYMPSPNWTWGDAIYLKRKDGI